MISVTKKTFLVYFVIPALGAAAATTVWNDGGGDQTWSTLANWSSGVPTSTSDVQIGTQPTGDQIGVDTGATTIGSLTFNNTLTASSDITAFGATDSLTINGGITNNSAFNQSISIGLSAGASATWFGSLSYLSNVSIGINAITLSGSSTFAGSNLNFDITSLSTYGRFLGSGTATVTGVTINIGGSYAGSSGDTFDFTTGSFSGATLGTLPTLTSGLAWNTTSFLSSGLLSVVAIPEPAAYAALFGAAVIGVSVWRKRRKA